jgi:hypothetical protein
MTNQFNLVSNAEVSTNAYVPHIRNQSERLVAAYIEFIHSVIGTPDYSFTLTLRPVAGSRRQSTKINDAEQAMNWFLHSLNTKCFGHGYRRNKLELGIFATLEGLGIGQQPHWHGAFRLPKGFPHETFLHSYEYAKSRTKRFGSQKRLEPYYESNWHQYTTKTGVESITPQFLRKGTP